MCGKEGCADDISLMRWRMEEEIKHLRGIEKRPRFSVWKFNFDCEFAMERAMVDRLTKAKDREGQTAKTLYSQN